MADHAKLSPSSAHRWMACAGSVVMESGYPDTSNDFADEGTAAHFLGAVCLEGEHDAALFIGRHILVVKGTTDWADKPDGAYTVDHEMASEVQKYLNKVRENAKGGELFVEQRLPFFAGDPKVPEQFGTGDAIILLPRRLRVEDLKYGKGVQVFAEENEQLMLYGLGALDKYDLLDDFDEVVLVIHQPRLNHYDEWLTTPAHLREFEKRAKEAAIKALSIVSLSGGQVLLNPGKEQCRFCKAKGGCPALRDQVLETVAGDFEVLTEPMESGEDVEHAPLPIVENLIELGKGEVAVSISDAEKILAAAHGVPPKSVDFEPAFNSEDDPMYCSPAQFIIKKPTIRPVLDGAEAREADLDDTHLAVCMESLDLVEGWCKAIRSEVERRLLAGTHVPGFKLVQGKAGNRDWSDAEEAAAMLKSFRLKVEEMHDLSLISPTTAEKRANEKLIGPKQWVKLQKLITRRPGGPSVAPASDKRPVWTPPDVMEDFDEVPDGDELDDLL
jgi:hypothetical protein